MVIKKNGYLESVLLKCGMFKVTHKHTHTNTHSLSQLYTETIQHLFFILLLYEYIILRIFNFYLA